MKIQKLYDKAYDWVLNHGPNFIIALVLLFAGMWFIKFLKRRIRAHMSTKEVHSSLQPFFLSLSVTALYLLLILSVLSILDFPISSFTAILGGFTVALGLALSGTFQNFAAGILILLLKPFELDDSILAQGQDGKVVSIQIFYTVLLTADNKTVIIPNGKLFNEVITNVTREGKRRLDLELKLEYAVDIDQVKEVILNSIKKTPNIMDAPVVSVGVIALELDGIRFTVRVWVEPGHFLPAKIALQENVIKDLKAAGIKLPGVAAPAPPAVPVAEEEQESEKH